jgi:hypothetical protein
LDGVMMAAARNATLSFRIGAFLRVLLKPVVVVAIVRWYVLLGA